MSITGTSGGAAPIESSKSAMSWGPIFGGAFAATGVTLILLLLGSGVGLTMISPWPGQSASAESIGVTAAIWLVVVQWLSAALGGYLTGRLRTKWAAIHSDEVFFRDTAHGLISWAVATVFVVGFLASSLTSLAGAGAQAVGQAATAASIAGAASASSESSVTDLSTSYFTDTLLRADQNPPQTKPPQDNIASEVSRILLQGAVQGEIPAEDKSYLATIVASRTGLSETDAKARVDAVLKRVDDAKLAAQEAADKGRKAAATTAMLGALSLIIGAFIASAAAAIGGRQRDEVQDVVLDRM